MSDRSIEGNYIPYTEIVLVSSFLDIEPKVDIKARDIKLLALDVENVLTDYGNPMLLPGAADHMEKVLEVNPNLRTILITNKKDEDFIIKVQKQLPGNPDYVFPGQKDGLEKKPSVTMFNEAIIRNPDVMVEQAAHVDDQFKAYFGAKYAEFGTFFWTKPQGEHQHKGVRLLRPVESVIRGGIAIKGYLDEGLLGD